jgi:hypothetical protein
MEIKLHLKRIGATGFHILANGQTVATFKRRSYKRACITLNQMENLLLAAGHPETPSLIDAEFARDDILYTTDPRMAIANMEGHGGYRIGAGRKYGAEKPWIDPIEQERLKAAGILDPEFQNDPKTRDYK